MLKNGVTHLNTGFDIKNLTSVDLLNMNEVYVCSSFACNLGCPHCTLKNLPIQMDLEKIEETLDYINNYAGPNVLYDLFGGEPLLLPDIALLAIYNKIKKRKFIVSTNLVPLRNTHLMILKDAQWVNTSWNPKRFDVSQTLTWERNVQELHENNVKINLMVTLTEDFVNYISPIEFINKVLKSVKPYSLDLDYVIGEDFTEERLEQIDKWLSNLYLNWNIPTIFNIADNIKKCLTGNRKYKDCSRHYTILPSGNVKPGCAYFETDVDKTKCLCCEYYPICNGACRLQTACTLPKRLFRIIKREICGMD